MIKSEIEWCDDTANIVTGCYHGCNYCYARKVAARLGGMKKTTYHLLRETVGDPFALAFHFDVYQKLDSRLGNVRSPRRVFIASMGDIGCKTFFHVTKDREVRQNGYRTADVMKKVHRLCTKHSRHTFLLLTKEPRSFLPFDWPGNVHIGTSIDSTDKPCRSRLSTVSIVKSFVKWVSIEPLLDPGFDVSKLELCDLDWVVVGGLSKGDVPVGCYDVAMRIMEYCSDKMIPMFVKNNLRRQFQGGVAWPQEYPRR